MITFNNVFSNLIDHNSIQVYLYLQNSAEINRGKIKVVYGYVKSKSGIIGLSNGDLSLNDIKEEMSFSSDNFINLEFIDSLEPQKLVEPNH